MASPGEFWNSTAVSMVRSIFIGAIAIVTVGGLTGFHESTTAQRAWTMTWLASGIFFGLMDSSVRTHIRRRPQSNPFLLKDFYIYGYVSPDSGLNDKARYTLGRLGFVHSLSAFASDSGWHSCYWGICCRWSDATRVRQLHEAILKVCSVPGSIGN